MPETQIPEVPVPTLEPVWLVEATYVANAAEARAPFRPTHLARAVELKAQGVILEVGAFADASASVLMLRAGTEKEALDLCREDVYWQNGIWVELKARAFLRVP
jgi:uncharacterized protein YciI